MKEMATESSEAKKLLIIRIMQILEYYSDANHPLKQEDIIKLLEDDYDIKPDRKAVGRALFVDAENKTTNPIDEFCMPTKNKTNLGLASAAKTIY